MAPAKFSCRSSSSDETYELVASRTKTGVKFTCSCPAGAYGQFCKHRHAVLLGDITALIAPDPEAIKDLQSLFADHPYLSMAVDLDALENQAATIKSRISIIRKTMAKALMG